MDTKACNRWDIGNYVDLRVGNYKSFVYVSSVFVKHCTLFKDHNLTLDEDNPL